ELKNADLARMQETLAAKQAQPAPPAPPPPREAARAAPAPLPAAHAPAEQAPVAQPAPPPPIPEEKPPQTATEAPPPPQSAKPAPTPAPPAAGGSLFDTLKGYWWQIGLLLLVLVGVAASRIVRSRRAAQFDDSLGRLGVASSDTVSFAPGRGFGSAQPMQAAASPEPAFLVEETGTQE